MEDKIKILKDYMKSLDSRLYVYQSYVCNSIYLKFGAEWYLGTYFLKDKKFVKSDKGRAPDEYDELEKYFYDFEELCKELFEGGNEMKEQKNIEVTNLDELQKLLNDSKKLVYKLQSKIDKINNWQPEYKEKEKDKIDILDEYMKEFNSHFFIIEYNGLIDLCYVDGAYGYWVICTYIVTDDKFVIYDQSSNLKNYNMVMYYYKDFVDKVKELYGKE